MRILCKFPYYVKDEKLVCELLTNIQRLHKVVVLKMSLGDNTYQIPRRTLFLGMKYVCTIWEIGSVPAYKLQSFENF